MIVKHETLENKSLKHFVNYKKHSNRRIKNNNFLNQILRRFTAFLEKWENNNMLGLRVRVFENCNSNRNF